MAKDWGANIPPDGDGDISPEELINGEKDELTILREELEKKSAEAKENYDHYMRALAEADNQRKRWQKDRDELIKFGNASFLRKLIPLADDFARARKAMESGGDLESLQKGVEMIEKRLADLFEQEGLTVIPAAGQEFDPQFHEALSVDETGIHPDGTIVQELQNGYLYNERVLRPSLVVVARSGS